ncbi:MAG: LLM class flavin-dependent oxidoreductase [Actinobacteria bacterium]|nr:LLM class flavin-dependent oxidoreductase [Actinomycetota bacterium]
MNAERPFGRGSVSLGLHVYDEHDGARQAGTIVAQARAAEAAGFSGVTFPEHHGGFPGYMGLPGLAANWVLGATERIWAAPAPYLLNLRNVHLAAEELAWSNARFPGRFGVALAPGYARSDFDLLGVEFEGKAQRFEEHLEELLPTLEARGDGAANPAFRFWAEHPAPIVGAVNTKVGVRRAARFGMSIFFPGGETRERMRELISVYREAGGEGTVSKVRPMWLGEAPAGAIEAREAMYAAAAVKGSKQSTGFREPFLHGDPDHVTAELLADVEEIGLDGLNLRFHLEGGTHEWVCEQIAAFGGQVLPPVQAALAR